jgi:hypothetical protein
VHVARALAASVQTFADIGARADFRKSWNQLHEFGQLSSSDFKRFLSAELEQGVI